MPWEQQLCETLDITTEEYFAYYDLVAQQVKEEQGRELIPDIRNEPVTIVTLVVGIALQVVGMLLAPKPRMPEQKKPGDPFQSQDVRGRTKYAPLAEFDSVQDLASLGSLVPLIYTLQKDGHGGVRAESQLLWSRMRNLPIYQELRALLLFSAGELDVAPDYKGFAFGDTKISGYMSAKLAIWFNRGVEAAKNKPFYSQEPRRYSEGTKDVGTAGFKPFSTGLGERERRNCFCGTVTPSQSAVFGQYSPIRNGHVWKYDFKWPGIGDINKEKRKLIHGVRRKHVEGYHAGQTTLRGTLENLDFKIWTNEADEINQSCGKDTREPEIEVKTHFSSNGRLIVRSWIVPTTKLAEAIGGVTEGIKAIEQSKVDADVALDVGELYIIGSDIYRCTKRENSQGIPGTPYEPGISGSVTYSLQREKEFAKGYASLGNITVYNNKREMYNEMHMPIQKVTIGTISTTRAVDFVEIGLKSTVYRQINGYPNLAQFTDESLPDEYAERQQNWQPGTIQAYYDRVSLFRLEIKRGNGEWFDWNNELLFAVHGTSPQPQYNQLYIQLPYKDFYEFRFIPVCGNTWIANGNYRNKPVLLLNSRMGLNAEDYTRSRYKIKVKGQTAYIENLFNMSHEYWATGERSPRNVNPNSLLNDFWYYNADTASHENEPEHQITWLNEYVENSDEWYADESKQYEHLAHAGLVCQSAKEISTFSNFSAYFTQGVIVKQLFNTAQNPYGPTNNFPEIAYDFLTNRRYGVGEYIGNNAIDNSRFKTAALYCDKNKFYWDGIISKQTNVREFLFEQAAYQLLDFTIMGGQFSLYPAVPFKSDYSIDHNAKAGASNFEIKALFTDGNVRNFKTTFLSPEERQLFTAELKYRKETRNGFPETHLTRVRLADKEGGYYRDPIELFDMTQFCTTRDHAIKFAKYALRLRQLVDHSVSFETTPDAAHSIAPGDYIRLGVSMQHQEKDRGYIYRLRTGSVAPNGTLQINKSMIVTPDGFDVYYWRPGFDGVREGKLQERNGMVLNTALHGCMFTRKISAAEARIYKVESIAYSEENFVEITGSYVPVTREGKMRLLEWDDSSFVIEDQGD